jgi:hypothetical protein
MNKIDCSKLFFYEQKNITKKIKRQCQALFSYQNFVEKPTFSNIARHYFTARLQGFGLSACRQYCRAVLFVFFLRYNNRPGLSDPYIAKLLLCRGGNTVLVQRKFGTEAQF